jgi:hypothetical protein
MAIALCRDECERACHTDPLMFLYERTLRRRHIAASTVRTRKHCGAGGTGHCTDRVRLDADSIGIA